MSTTTLPAPKEVRDLLADLLGRDVDVSTGRPVAAGPLDSVAVAVYVDDATRMGSLVVTDLPLAAYAGAAIGLVPATGAKAAVEDRSLSPAIRDNLYEVLNVFAALFNKEGATHLRLYSMYEPGERPPADVMSWSKALGRRLDLDVKITGYGAGRLSVVLT